MKNWVFYLSMAVLACVLQGCSREDDSDVFRTVPVTNNPNNLDASQGFTGFPY